MRPTRFYLLVRETDKDKWRNSGEGPWKTKEEAIQFGNAECGVDWCVAHGTTIRTAIVSAIGASVCSECRGPYFPQRLPTKGQRNCCQNSACRRKQNTEYKREKRRSTPKRFQTRTGSIQECPLHIYELAQRIANRIQDLLRLPKRYHDILPEVLDELVATRKGLR
jgi:hypothetical protein